MSKSEQLISRRLSEASSSSDIDDFLENASHITRLAKVVVQFRKQIEESGNVGKFMYALDASSDKASLEASLNNWNRLTAVEKLPLVKDFLAAYART